MTNELSIENLKPEIQKEATYPTNGDLVVKAFYDAVLGRITRAEQNPQGIFGSDDPLLDALHDTTLLRRPQPTPRVFTSLLFRAYQYARFSSEGSDPENLEYVQFFQPEQWDAEFDTFFGSPELKGLFLTAMMEKTVSTTIYERYSAIWAILAKLKGEQPITMADFGASMNFGLTGFSLGIPFKPILDETPHQLFSSYLRVPINLSQGFAIDRETPDPIWYRACKFLPKEFGQIEQDINRERAFTESPRVRFMKGDFLTQDLLPQKVDAIILSTVAYQADADTRAFMIFKSMQWLNPDGLLILGDFAKKTSTGERTGLNFDIPWYAKPGEPDLYNYRVHVYTYKDNNVIYGAQRYRPQEILAFNGGRCKKVRKGADFELIFDDYAS